jgi:hypothetical protein
MTRQSDTSILRFRGVTKWPTQACTIPGGDMRAESDALNVLLVVSALLLLRLLSLTRTPRHQSLTPIIIFVIPLMDNFSGRDHVPSIKSPLKINQS